MTTYAKNLTKASILSIVLTLATILLDGVRKSGYTMETETAGMFEFVIGVFASISVIATIVYLFVQDN